MTPREVIFTKIWNSFENHQNVHDLTDAILTALAEAGHSIIPTVADDAEIERVARSLWDKDNESDNIGPWEQAPEHWKKTDRGKARAAAAAVRGDG